MSDHTNRNLYFKNLYLNRHVGGTMSPQLQTEKSYIDDQEKVLIGQNIMLPPMNRYNTNYDNNNNNNNNNNKNKSHDTSYKNILQNNYNYGCCRNPNIKNNISMLNNGNMSSSLKNDVYLRGEDKYDPYNGYMYKKGLMDDGNQRRKIQSTFIDINSLWRIINPSINTNTPILLSQDPLQFTNNSNTVFINHPNSGYSVNDPITLTGVFSKISTLRTFTNNIPTFEIPAGCNFMKILYNHGIPLNYTGTSIQIELSGIQGDRGTTDTSAILGSIPTNIINGPQTVMLTLTDDDILCTTNSIIASTGNPNYFSVSSNYFFIILQSQMQNLGDQTPYTLRDYNFTLTFNSLAGIPLNIINATYPISPNNLNGFQLIKSVNNNGYTISLSMPAIINTGTLGYFNGGGKAIYVSLITDIINGYPDPNSYNIPLGDVFHNVLSVRLVSTEIPNTEKMIRDTPTERANNNIYWNDIDDGDYLYNIVIPPGNYSPTDLITIIQNQFSQTLRINAITEESRAALNITYTANHFVQTSINQNTDEVTFQSYKEFIVNYPINSVIPEPPDSPAITVDPNITYQLVINQPGNGMITSGLTILIQGAIAHKGIPADIINGEHVVNSINYSQNSNLYTIQLPVFNLQDDRSSTNGGIGVFIYIPDLFRMRYDQPYTMGSVLGFRNPGASTSITNYNTIISNKNPYQYESGTNTLGQSIQITNNAIQLSGDNYIIMVIDQLKTLKTIGSIKNAFAKIILCDLPGKILYNSFVPINYVFDNPIYELHELDISFYSPDGYLFDFNGVDHSFTLEIVTISDIPDGTGLNANTGKNYNQKI